jgi:translation initiation factor IF-2
VPPAAAALRRLPDRHQHVAALKRFKDDAREVTEGFECGILLDGFNDLREGDVFEVFETRNVERTSLDTPAGAAEAPASES